MPIMQSELQIEPRYPLLGGWKTSFVIGYSLPLESSLFEMSDGRHCLKFNFGSPFLETVVDKLTIKVFPNFNPLLFAVSSIYCSLFVVSPRRHCLPCAVLACKGLLFLGIL